MQKRIKIHICIINKVFFIILGYVILSVSEESRAWYLRAAATQSDKEGKNSKNKKSSCQIGNKLLD